MTTDTSAPVTFSSPERRLEGPLKVRGAAGYTDDVPVPGALWAGFVSSPYPHARIAAIDTSGARALPGVHALLTGAGIGGARFGRNLLDWPVLATEVVRFIGERVVAVAAESRELVDEAVRLVDVEYEELPAVHDPSAALAPDAPVLHPDAAGYRTLRGPRPVVAHPNVQGNLVVARGDDDIEGALSAADLVVESTFSTPRHHCGFLEPHAAVVWLEPDGTVRVVSTSKEPFALARQMAAALDLPAERIVVDNAFVGGDFGGKGLSALEFPLYFLARATGRPVRAVLPYSDELAATSTRHAATMRLRTGVNRDGTFVAHAAELVFDGGAYAAAKPSPQLVLGGGLATMSAYAVPHTRLEMTTVYTNTVPGGHMRSPGEVQAVFAGESHVDVIASRLGIDPIELRRRNAVRAGRPNATGETFPRPAAVDVLDAVRTAARWDQPRPPGRGIGVALYQRGAGTGRGGVILRALPDGGFELVTGSVDQGGGTHTALRRIAAASLGVAEDAVVVVRRSTRQALFDSGVGASRVTRVLGEATRRAAAQLRERLAAEGGGDVAIEARGEYEATGRAEDSSFIAEAVEVEVDPETGAVTLLDAVIAVDVGEVINPVAHRGQLEGGFAFGLGAALMEDLAVEDGQVLTSTLGDYKLPTVADMPPLRIVEVRPEGSSRRTGPKAVGELSNSGVPPAVANAVAAAVGVRLSSLPLTAEAIHAELRRVGARPHLAPRSPRSSLAPRSPRAPRAM
ncbi:MAG TPA: xanthine dehydrogenase family protein molybdopterin-binding subunit [Streptosporangiales bacterium]